MSNHGPGELGADQLLLQAEKLLLEVTGCIKPSAPRNVVRESQIIDDLLLNPDHKSLKVCNPESDLAQIEWLLRGVPEAYDSEPQVDDEMVMALLKEGGNPPKQLVLPSIYATNQLVLEKLSLAKLLRISLTNLLVLSVRYGVRKEGTFLRVYPPSGCNLPANEAGSIMIPLPELKDPSSQIGQLLRKNDKRDSLRNYFVGAIDLKNSYELGLTMSEKVVREWIHSAPNGTLRLELYGYLAPHATAVRGTLAEAVPLASAAVPLGGLLGTPSLDAVVHCDLNIDAYTHAMVLSRMRNLSFGQNVSKQSKTLGPKLGTVTVRVSILSDPKPSTQSPASDPTRDHKLLHEVQPLMMPVISSAEGEQRGETVFEESFTSHTRTTTQVTESRDRIHSALAYVPSEHPHNLPGVQMTKLPPLQTREHSSRAVYGPNKHVNGVFALALCGIESLSVPIEKAVEIQQTADRTGVDAAPRITISYKTSARDRETVSKELDFSNREQAANYDLLQGKVYYTDMLTWTAPVMEVWLCWNALDPSQALATSDDQQELRHNSAGHHTMEQRQLLGLARFPTNYKLGAVARLPIGDVARGVQRGVLVVAAVLGREEDLVETSLQCLLNFHTLDRRGTYTPPPVPRAPTRPAESSAAPPSRHSADALEATRAVQDTQSEGDEESKQDPPQGLQGTTRQDIAQEEEEGHDEALERRYELDDSIGDIISFLNDHDPQEYIAGRPDADARAPSRHHPLSASTSSINEFLARERDATAAKGDDVRTEEKEGAQGQAEESEALQDVRRSSESVRSASTSSAEVFRPAHGPVNLHLLDFSVDGVFSAVRPTHSAYSSAAIFGCYVKYSLPDLDPVDTTSATASGPDHALWWDGDCAVLNGSLRHQIELAGVSASSLSEALGLSACIKFFLHVADAEGNMPAEPIVLGEAALQLSELAEFMGGNSGFAVISLPVSLHHAALPKLKEEFEVVQQHPEILLKLSHRIEPVLMRKSLDSSRFAVEATHAPSTSLDQPPWRLRYETEIPPSVQDPSEEEHQPPVPSSSLLGFELTQHDLDGMMYFRDPSAPLPWVPFEASQATEPEGRPVLTTALGGRAITVREGVEVDLDAALKKSIYELEFIGGMFGHRAEPAEVPLVPDTIRESYEGGGSRSESESESDQDMYKSDFESLEEDADLHDIAQTLERDADAPNVATSQLDESGDSNHSQYFSDAPPEEGDAESDDSDVEDVIAGRVAHLKFLISEHFKYADPVREDTSREQEQVDSSVGDSKNYEDCEEASAENHAIERKVEIPLPVVLIGGEDGEKGGEATAESRNISTTSATRSSENSLTDVDALMQGVVAEAAEAFGAVQATPLTEEVVAARLAAEELRLRFDSPASYFQAELESPHPNAEALGNDQEDWSADDEELQLSQSQRDVVEPGEGMKEGMEEGTERDMEEGGDTSVISAHSCEPSDHAVECATQTDVRDVSLDLDVSVSLSLPDHSFGHQDPLDESSATSHNATAAEDASLTRVFGAELTHEEPAALHSVHFSVHTDPDASNVSAFREQAAYLSYLSSVSGLNRSGEENQELENSRESCATAPSATRRPYPREEREDSPDTSKIKNIVDKQIEKFFGAEVLTHPLHSGSPDTSSVHQLYSQAPDVLSVHQWWSRIDNTKASATPPAAPVVPLTSAAKPPPSETELFRANLSKVQALLPAGLVSRGGARKHPGWQGRFLDKETDRASNIMNSVFNKSDHV